MNKATKRYVTAMNHRRYKQYFARATGATLVLLASSIAGAGENDSPIRVTLQRPDIAQSAPSRLPQPDASTKSNPFASTGVFAQPPDFIASPASPPPAEPVKTQQLHETTAFNPRAFTESIELSVNELSKRLSAPELLRQNTTEANSLPLCSNGSLQIVAPNASPNQTSHWQRKHETKTSDKSPISMHAGSNSRCVFLCTRGDFLSRAANSEWVPSGTTTFSRSLFDKSIEQAYLELTDDERRSAYAATSPVTYSELQSQPERAAALSDFQDSPWPINPPAQTQSQSQSLYDRPTNDSEECPNFFGGVSTNLKKKEASLTPTRWPLQD